MCFLVWKYGSFITLFLSTHVERLYIIIPHQVLHLDLEQQCDAMKISRDISIFCMALLVLALANMTLIKIEKHLVAKIVTKQGDKVLR